ncbi:MAG: lytic murein transglycosylase B [Burkholderiaceae bacterium]|jgi:membrane-bound lytic murein transglycosylase B|nr:lytic murein transglycosylase B [Burkholderiaceae bacterium]
MNRRRTLAALAMALLAAPGVPVRAQDIAAPAAGGPLPYHLREDVQAYIDELVARHGLDREFIERAFAQARYSEQAERLTTPSLAPAAARNWIDYRARNVDERRIRDGAQFLRDERIALERAQQQYGVPPEIVCGILGIETVFGRNTGSFRTLDVLLTLSFDYTRRAPMYREELAQFLLLCAEQGIDPLAQRGSFAGAVGLPQFMPGSIRRWAVDFDGDGRVDLRNRADAVGSVASFLAAHGWQRDLPVQFRARAEAGVAEVLGGGIVALYPWRDVAALGVSIDGALEADTRVLLLDLPWRAGASDTGVEHRLGTVNMQALLHYNRSYFYGVAVADLARAIRIRASA